MRGHSGFKNFRGFGGGGKLIFLDAHPSFASPARRNPLKY